jgi:hypothetical protein
MFISYGISIAFSETVPIWIMICSILTVGYGVGSIAALVWAWRSGENKTINFIKYTAFSFLAMFFIASMDVGMISGLEFFGIIVVSLLLFINWYSVKIVACWKEHS